MKVGRKVVARDTRGELVRRFQAADHEAVEALVVGFGARDEARREAALEANQRVPGAFAP